jgi:ABC-2 type transport system permease protein
MQASLVPHWIRDVSRYNPVNWAVVAARSAAMDKTDWGMVAGRFGLLLALAVLAAWFATRAFRTYQRSV